jgi:hypothetical protein
MMPLPVTMPLIDVHIVMPGLVPGIHVFASHREKKDVDGRDRRQVYAVCAWQTAVPGHDDAAATGATP